MGRFYPVIKAFPLGGPARRVGGLPRPGPPPRREAPGERGGLPPGLGQAPPRHGKAGHPGGGIAPENLEEVLALRPYALDLASGVEEAPGVKSAEKLRALFARLASLRMEG